MPGRHGRTARTHLPFILGGGLASGAPAVIAGAAAPVAHGLLGGSRLASACADGGGVRSAAI